ncbi:MAG: DUF885 domain-containing protein [Lachnospira sp.]|nr:DUF885 domain-containing protein [Lachnospira sp.]
MKQILKRFIAITLIICMIFPLNACVKNDSNETPSSTREYTNSDTINVSLKNSTEFDKFLTDIFVNELNSCSTLDIHYFLSDPAVYGINTENTKFSLIDFDNLFSTQESKELLNSLNQYNYDALTKEQQINYDILKYRAELDIENASLALYENIFNPTTGLQAQMPILLAEYDFRNEADITQYIELLKKLPEYYNNLISFEQLKANSGLGMSDECIEGIKSQCADFSSKKEDNYLIEIFNSKIDAFTGLSEDKAKVYKAQNKAAVLEYVIPAYIMLFNELDALKGKCSYNYLGETKEGRAYFEYLLKSNVGTAKTTTQLESLINSYQTKCLLGLSTALNNNPNLLDTLENPTFPSNDPKEILSYLEENMLKDFPEIPKTSYSINYVHESLEDHLSPAFYLTPPIDDMSKHSIYINNAAANSFTGLFPTLAHEGFPGHLYQNLYYNSTSPNVFRSLMSFTGYSEGWATYVELMSYYYCGFDTNTANALFYYNLYNLLIYASLDIGINYYGWSDELIASKTGITDTNVINELRTMISCDPANYLNYVIGCLEILELKENYKTLYESDYSDKAFHTFILNMGEAPFTIIEKWMLKKDK